jgi:flagellar basal-body rod protein FlgG
VIRGLYSAANGLLAESTRADVTAANLAGLSVPGFRRDIASVSAFGRTLDYLGGQNGAGLVGPSALLAPATTVDLQPGAMRATGGRLDLALDGQGYFCVQTPTGEAYTRSGAFRIDQSRRLVTTAGDPVLGTAGPVRITGSSAEVTAGGDIVVDGRVVDRLKLVDFAPGARIEKLGNGLLRPAPTAGLPQTRGFGTEVPKQRPVVRQGYLEEPNVNAVTELAALISSLRSFEASQRALQANDQTLEKAINEVGRV